VASRAWVASGCPYAVASREERVSHEWVELAVEVVCIEMGVVGCIVDGGVSSVGEHGVKWAELGGEYYGVATAFCCFRPG
jgi:hypothetical protein